MSNTFGGARARSGRKSRGGTAYDWLAISYDPEQLGELEQKAEQLGTSRSALVEHYVRRGIESGAPARDPRPVPAPGAPTLKRTSRGGRFDPALRAKLVELSRESGISATRIAEGFIEDALLADPVRLCQKGHLLVTTPNGKRLRCSICEKAKRLERSA